MRPHRTYLAAFLILAVVCLSGPAGASGEKARRYYVTGVSLIEDGNYRDAVKNLRRAVHEDFTFADAHAKLAQAYAELGTIEGRRLAVEEYRLALRYDPHNPEYHLALGRIHAARTFAGYAEASFLKAIEIAPDSSPAYLDLGLLRLEPWVPLVAGRADLRSAYHVLCEGCRRGSPSRELLYNLGWIATELGDTHFAEEVLLRILEQNPRDTEACFQYALTLHEQERLEEAEAQYLRAVCESRSEERTPFLGVEDIRSSLTLSTPADTEGDSLADFVRRFWRQRDPRLATTFNERFLEHCRRVVRADLYFSAPKIGLRGRDSDRGRAYIRYGPPTHIQASAGGGSPHTVVWAYAIGGRRFHLTFRDPFQKGEFGFGSSIKSSSKDVYETLAGEFPQHYEPEYRGKRVRLTASACSFFRRPGSVHQEIYCSIPEEDLYLAAGESEGCAHLEKQIVIYDEDWRIVREETTAVTLSPAGPVVDQSSFDLKPGRYLAAISIEDTAAALMGLCEVELAAREFDPSRLEISDIELASAIRVSDEPGPFHKGTLYVEPQPSRQYDIEKPVVFYYEVYGLTPDYDGQSRFMLTVGVFPLEVKESRGFLDRLRGVFSRGPGATPHVTVSFAYASNSRSVPYHLSLDLARLWVGRYRLVLEIDDLVGGASVSCSTELILSRGAGLPET